MCTNQEDIWVCDRCKHEDHTPQSCTRCDCYNCDPKHDCDWDDAIWVNCCRCAEMAADHGE